MSRCTLAEDIPEQLAQLQVEAGNSLYICGEYGRLDNLDVWNGIHNNWWFDDSYLGEQIDKIEEFFHLLEEYSCLPRLRGTGHKIESWVRSSGIETKYEEAKVQFTTIFADV